jgi:general secretion pathway protein N
MTIKKWLGYLLFTLFSYLLFLIATLPAVQLYSVTKEYLPTVKLEQVNGSIWDGSTQQIKANAFQIGPVYWQFNPLSLLLGQAEIGFTTTDKKLQITGNAAVNFSGDIVLSDIKGESSAEAIASFIPNLPVTPVGRVTFDLSEVTFSQQRLSTVTGKIDWLQAGVKQPIEIQIGKINLLLNSDSDGIHGTIADKGATVGINAQLELQQSGQYQVKGKIQPKAETPTDLSNALKMLGRPNPAGAIPINLSGSI